MAQTSMTYQEVLEADAGVKAVGSKQVPWRATIKLVRLGKNLAGAVEEFQEARKRIAEQYGLKDGDKPSKEYMAAMNDLLAEKVSLKLSPLKLSDLKGSNGSEPSVEAGALLALGPLLEDDWDEQEPEADTGSKDSASEG